MSRTRTPAFAPTPGGEGATEGTCGAASLEAASLETGSGGRLDLGILSIGYTRDAWSSDLTEDQRRLRRYAARVRRYVLLTHSRKDHGLRPRRLGPGFSAVPSGARTPVDGFLRLFRIGSRLCASGRYSLVQAQDPVFTGPVAILLGRKHRLPVNVCVYGMDPHDAGWRSTQRGGRLLAPVGRWTLRRADSIQVDGAATRRRLIEGGVPPWKIHRKPMLPGDIGRFLDISREPARTDGEVRLLWVGRLSAEKDLPLLLEAFRDLRRAAGDATVLEIVGAGPEADALQGRARAMGVERSVRFAGHLDRAALVGAFAAADIFVLCSRYEGFPRALMEACAAALPVVMTAVGGAGDLVRHGAEGLVVGGGRPEAFAAALGELVRDPDARRRMGASARRRLLDRLGDDPARWEDRQVAIWSGLVDGTSVERPERSERPREARRNVDERPWRDKYDVVVDHLSRARGIAPAPGEDDRAGGHLLLDVGCRDAVLRARIAEGWSPGADGYIGLDRERPPTAAPDVVADAESGLPFPDRAFESVVALDVLEHLDHFDSGLREAARVAADTLLVVLPNMGFAPFRLDFLLHGRFTSTDKYDLREGARRDRHRWLTSVATTDPYMERFARRHGWHLETVRLSGSRKKAWLLRAGRLLGLPPSVYTWKTLYVLRRG